MQKQQATVDTKRTLDIVQIKTQTFNANLQKQNQSKVSTNRGNSTPNYTPPQVILKQRQNTRDSSNFTYSAIVSAVPPPPSTPTSKVSPHQETRKYTLIPQQQQKQKQQSPIPPKQPTLYPLSNDEPNEKEPTDKVQSQELKPIQPIVQPKSNQVSLKPVSRSFSFIPWPGFMPVVNPQNIIQKNQQPEWISCQIQSQYSQQQHKQGIENTQYNFDINQTKKYSTRSTQTLPPRDFRSGILQDKGRNDKVSSQLEQEQVEQQELSDKLVYWAMCAFCSASPKDAVDFDIEGSFSRLTSLQCYGPGSFGSKKPPLTLPSRYFRIQNL
eukprot:TRINITY_DN3813_c1_g1_i5.p1 TRINITY_DN3813_c1_g1~~TRINITY_DN3813_c1_g1_i5.p1  ORF type:complete len:326 (+),score=35.11 TRINITY_DN3813_c1_g1_i5:313-1290(+)